MYLFGAAHDDVPYPRNDVAGDVMGHAVFYNDISFMTVKTADEDDAGVLDNGGRYVPHHVFGHNNVCHFEVGIHVVVFHDVVHVHAVFIAHQHRRYRRMDAEIPSVSSDGPENDDDALDYERCYQGQGIHQMAVHKGHDDIEKTVGNKNCQNLAVNQVRYPRQMDGIAAIESGNQVIDDKEETNHHIIAQIIKGIGHFVSIVQSPGQGKYRSQQEQVKELHDADVQSLVRIAV